MGGKGVLSQVTAEITDVTRDGCFRCGDDHGERCGRRRRRADRDKRLLSTSQTMSTNELERWALMSVEETLSSAVNKMQWGRFFLSQCLHKPFTPTFRFVCSLSPTFSSGFLARTASVSWQTRPHPTSGEHRPARSPFRQTPFCPLFPSKLNSAVSRSAPLAPQTPRVQCPCPLSDAMSPDASRPPRPNVIRSSSASPTTLPPSSRNGSGKQTTSQSATVGNAITTFNTRMSSPSANRLHISPQNLAPCITTTAVPTAGTTWIRTLGLGTVAIVRVSLFYIHSLTHVHRLGSDESRVLASSTCTMGQTS